MTINEEQLEEILERVLNSKRTVDNKTHAMHHKFISEYMKHWESRQKTWNKFKQSFVGGVALAIVGMLIWVGKLILEHWPKMG